MTAHSPIDITFDFRSDTPGFPKRDPDLFSPTLRSYHQRLWSKPLPNGVLFTLDGSSRHYLHHRSHLGEFFLASDTVVPTLSRRPQVASFIEKIPHEDRESFHRIGYTIGAMMIFPGERINGKMTINGARGFHPLICDRFDLTVECIRRYYRGERSPLSDVLARYEAFFRLFSDFRGYVEFFLLHDIVNPDCTAVEMFTPFDNFKVSPVPRTLDAYVDYRERAVRFIEARNRRIAVAPLLVAAEASAFALAG
jgi:hypothetical protein